jgi:hypothetical protein
MAEAMTLSAKMAPQSPSSARERELERGLLTHLRDLLLELGRGLAFVGSQVPLEVDGQTFYLDLLFYQVELHWYFVIDLKVGANFYLSAADALLRTTSDAPTLGLLLCESKGESIVEYALRDFAKLIGSPHTALPVSCQTHCATKYLLSKILKSSLES